MVQRSAFQIHFPKEIWGNTTSVNEYPSRYKYAISFLSPLLTYTQIGTFLIQHYATRDMLIELWSLHLHKEASFNLGVKNDVTAVGLSLKNRLAIKTGVMEWKIRGEKRYRIMHLPAGKHKLKAFRGITNFLLILPPSYLLETIEDDTMADRKELINPGNQTTATGWLTKEFPVDITLRRIIKQLEKLKPGDKNLRPELLACINRMIFHYAFSQGGVDNKLEQPRSVLAAHEARKYILQNLKEPGIGNVQQLCRMFGISDKPLKREFEKLTSLTIPAFIKEQRLQIGLKVANDPSLSVSDMAHIAGYTEVSNFIRDFKRRFGRTPKKRPKNL